jgi:hypothetical protein
MHVTDSTIAESLQEGGRRQSWQGYIVLAEFEADFYGLLSEDGTCSQIITFLNTKTGERMIDAPYSTRPRSTDWICPDSHDPKNPLWKEFDHDIAAANIIDWITPIRPTYQFGVAKKDRGSFYVYVATKTKPTMKDLKLLLNDLHNKARVYNAGLYFPGRRHQLFSVGFYINPPPEEDCHNWEKYKCGLVTQDGLPPPWPKAGNSLTLATGVVQIQDVAAGGITCAMLMEENKRLREALGELEANMKRQKCLTMDSQPVSQAAGKTQEEVDDMELVSKRAAITEK